MEPSPAASSAAPSVALTPKAAGEKEALPRPYFWAAVVAAGVLPIILLATLIAVLAATNYNFLEWME